MRIKEAARKTGLTEKTIRYYESRGLVQPDTENPDDLLSTVENVISMVQSVIEDFGERFGE